MKLKQKILIILSAFAMTVGIAIAGAESASAYGANGRICTSKSTSKSNAYDAEMDNGKGTLDLLLTPANGYCTDYYHPTWSIYNLRINPWTQCESQYGYIYKSNKGISKSYGWSGNTSTSLTLTCYRVGIDGTW